VATVERRYAFTFPPDLRAFVQTGLPCSQGFPNWRTGPEEALRDSLEWPLEGICFYIEHNGFWMDDWGIRPASLDEAFRLARLKVANAPVLIPVYGHRYMPDEPSLSGNPVMSVWQTDIIYYGCDLASYLEHEFGVESPTPVSQQPRAIRFWK